MIFGHSFYGGKENGRLFETMDAFYRLASLHEQPGFPKRAFLSVTQHAFKTVSCSLHSALVDVVDIKRLRSLDMALSSVLSTAVAVVGSWSNDEDDSFDSLSLLLNQALDLFLGPAIAAFFSLTEQNLVCLGSSGPSSHLQSRFSGPVDGRPSHLALLQGAFLGVRSSLLPKTGSSRDQVHLSKFTTMLQSAMLETARQFRTILLMDSCRRQNDSHRHRRMNRLAVKDTMWYLCSLMHFLLEISAETLDQVLEAPLNEGQLDSRPHHTMHNNPSSDLLSQATMDIMSEILRYQDRAKTAHLTKAYKLGTGVQRDFSPEEGSIEKFASFHDPSKESTNKSAPKVDKYLILDNAEYRAFLHMVEKFVLLVD